VLRIIGIQSAYLHNKYVRGKQWGAILRGIGHIDEELRSEVNKAMEIIASRLGRSVE
jgi:hypothetical protein